MALAFVLACYGVGAWYFSSHFVPGTTVNGVDASLMTSEALADALEVEAHDYEQRLTAPGGFAATLSPEDANLELDGQAVAEEAQKRCTSALWLPYLISPRHMLIAASVSVDESKLAKAIQRQVDTHNAQAEPSTSASASYDEDEGHYVLVPARTGTMLAADSLVAASAKGFARLEPEVHVGSDALRTPKVDSDDESLKQAIEQANKLLDTSFDITADGTKVVTVDHDVVAAWVSIGEDHAVHISGISDWLEANSLVQDAANAMDDQYVWALDVEETTQAILAALKAGSDEPVEVVRYAKETKPQVTEGAKERGRHIDVDLGEQFVRFYDADGEVIWESYCVSGGYDTKYGDTHNTPTGTFYIESKQTNQTLVGADRDNDGEPDYESYVNYWVPFLNNDWGFHDATWRSEFGGDIRSWWGSHGCINLPLEKAAAFFDLVQVGDMVYIHE
jgi:lipoprotein-anchoring transpeptidase ErfK/SrfK